MSRTSVHIYQGFLDINTHLPKFHWHQYTFTKVSWTLLQIFLSCSHITENYLIIERIKFHNLKIKNWKLIKIKRDLTSIKNNSAKFHKSCEQHILGEVTLQDQHGGTRMKIGVKILKVVISLSVSIKSVTS